MTRKPLSLPVQANSKLHSECSDPRPMRRVYAPDDLPTVVRHYTDDNTPDPQMERMMRSNRGVL